MPRAAPHPWEARTLPQSARAAAAAPPRRAGRRPFPRGAGGSRPARPRSTGPGGRRRRQRGGGNHSERGGRLAGSWGPRGSARGGRRRPPAVGAARRSQARARVPVPVLSSRPRPRPARASSSPPPPTFFGLLPSDFGKPPHPGSLRGARGRPAALAVRPPSSPPRRPARQCRADASAEVLVWGSEKVVLQGGRRWEPVGPGSPTHQPSVGPRAPGAPESCTLESGLY